jgi:hypothetical protein
LGRLGHASRRALALRLPIESKAEGEAIEQRGAAAPD